MAIFDRAGWRSGNFNHGGNNGTVTIPINGRAAPPTEANFAVLD
jgi:hypothetical protein